MQPIGAAGELCISGAGLARGYYKQQELTQKAFSDHPFLEGERLYRTGDAGRFLPDGTIEYIGRFDDQVKIRGYRIELREIETVLRQAPGVKEAAVLTVMFLLRKRSSLLISFRKRETASQICISILPGHCRPI